MAFICLMAASLSAQTQKGSMMIGGTAGFSSSKAGDETTMEIVFAPMVGYFVIDQLAIGGGFSVGLLTAKEFNTTVLGIDPTVRYYFNGSGSTRLFGQAAFRYASVKVENFDAQTGTGFGIGTGINYFLNDHVALEAILGYNSFKAKNADDATGTFGLQFGVSAFVGGK